MSSITWAPHGDYGEIAELNGWSAQVHDCDGHELSHPAGTPFLWWVEPVLKGGKVAEGYTASPETGRQEAETHLRRFAVKPAPKDPTVWWAPTSAGGAAGAAAKTTGPARTRWLARNGMPPRTTARPSAGCDGLVLRPGAPLPRVGAPHGPPANSEGRPVSYMAMPAGARIPRRPYTAALKDGGRNA